MNYEECLDYLDQASKFGIKLGLENITILLEELGSPQNSFPSVLVAGTNGKGSVCAMIHSVLERHGWRVGLYTSPHLVQVEERIRVNQEMISPEEFCQNLSFLRERVEILLKRKKLLFPPTYFELLTCLAFLYFEKKAIELAVLEVGLGGRLDATNVVNPLVSIITTISLDHQEHLGKTRRKIAGEKAGIIKPGIPVVCGQLPRAAFEAIVTRATEVGAPLIKVFGRGKLFRLPQEDSTYVFYHKGEKYIFRPGLVGQHQAKNAAIAIASLEILDKKWRPLKKEKIIEGLEKVVWEGRLEKIRERPAVYLDGAHNEEGAKALRRFWEKQAQTPLILVFSILKDKDIRRVAQQLFPLANEVIITSIPSPRAASPEEILRLTSDLNDKILIEADCLQSLDMAEKKAMEKGTVLITGSLYLVGEIKKRLRERQASI